MRPGISITLKPAIRRRLAALAKDRNAAHKQVWQAEIVLLSAMTRSATLDPRAGMRDGRLKCNGYSWSHATDSHAHPAWGILNGTQMLGGQH